MNINWSELGRGISAELSNNSEKTAGVPLGGLARAGGTLLAKNLPLIGGVTHGVSAVSDLMGGDWTGAALNTGAGIADAFGAIPIGMTLDGINLARGLVGGDKDKQQAAPKFEMPQLPPATQPQPQPPLAAQPQLPPLTVNMSAKGVNSLSTPPLKLAAAKTANMVDAVENALRNRVINNALDKVMMPLENTQQGPIKSKKEVELISQHPEMAKLLEDKHNKAYLERLLKA